MQGSDETDEGKRRLPRIHFTPRSIAWLIGAAALIAATSAAGLVANSPSSEPTAAAAAAADTSSTKNALDAILSRNPDVGQPISALIKSGKLPNPSYAGDTGRVGIPKSATFPSAPAGSHAVYVPGSVNGDFNLLQLSALALYVGCSPAEAPIAAAIAAAESGGNPGAQGDIALMDGTWDWSQGLWQIRGLRSERGTGGLRDSLANANPEKNGRAMYTISSGCKDWTPWSTYTSGAYLSYLGMSKTAVLAAQQYQQRTGALPSFGTGNTVGVPSASSSSSRSSGKPGTRKPSSGGKSKPPTRHHRKPTSGGSTHPVKTPKPGSSTTPVPAATSQAPAPPKSSLPVKLPSLPVKTSLPVKLPTKTKLPTKLPSLPVKLPTSSLPSIPVP